MRWWSSSSDTQNATSANPEAASQPSPMHVAKLGQENEDKTLAEILPAFSVSERASETSSTIDETNAKRHNANSLSALYPSTMSCREAFDQAYHCQSMSGQFLNVYRYGERRQCKDQWAQFWFCMRNRGKPDDVKAELIQEFYKQKEGKYGSGPSCEDVWNQRTERVLKAFNLGFEDVELEDTRKR